MSCGHIEGDRGWVGRDKAQNLVVVGERRQGVLSEIEMRIFWRVSQNLAILQGRASRCDFNGLVGYVRLIPAAYFDSRFEGAEVRSHCVVMREVHSSFQIKFPDGIDRADCLRESVGRGIVNVDAVQHRKFWSGGIGGIDAEGYVRRAVKVGAGKLAVLTFAGHRELIVEKRLAEIDSFARGNAVYPLLRGAIEMSNDYGAVRSGGVG